jgi:hypothetical protein
VPPNYIVCRELHGPANTGQDEIFDLVVHRLYGGRQQWMKVRAHCRVRDFISRSATGSGATNPLRPGWRDKRPPKPWSTRNSRDRRELDEGC